MVDKNLITVEIGKGVAADIAQLVSNFENVKKNIETALSEEVNYIVKDLLTKTQPKVPVDTGELRESGVAVIDGEVVAQGKKDGSVSIEGNMPFKRDQSQAFVHYSRYSKKGWDVAVWAHENLNAYGRTPPAVRVHTTMPKYLESTWRENYPKYYAGIEGITTITSPKVKQKLAQAVKTKLVKKSKSQVDTVRVS